MWHKVTFVAKIHDLPEADLVEFAISREGKYGIIIENGDALVSTWHCDSLLNDFRRYEEEECNHLENQFLMPDVGCEFDPNSARQTAYIETQQHAKVSIMALTGCHEHIIKEFNYMPGGIAVRLVQGFDNDHPAYYAIRKRTGLNLPMGHEKYGCIESRVLSCTQENYARAAKHFKEIVQDML